MLTLIIDTSHKYLAVGLLKNDEVIGMKQEVVKKQQSEFLIPFLNDLFTTSNESKENVGKIVVSDGPGSYTGMRIALTFVKTLCLTRPDVEVYTVNTLLSLSGLKTGFSMIDARSSRVFGAFVGDGVVCEERVYQLDEVKTFDDELFGDRELIDLPTEPINVIQNTVDVKKSWQAVENIDTLVPRYIK